MPYFRIRNIILGWWRYLFKPHSTMANQRLAICDKCQYRKGYKCGLCHCVLAAKAEVEEEECPAKKW